jgi:two-component system, response regulator
MVPGVIVLDLRLKTSEGLDLLRQIRFTPRLSKTLVFVFTSSNAAIDKQRSLLLGATRFVPKPLKVEEYFRTVREIVQHMIPPLPSPTPGQAL